MNLERFDPEKQAGKLIDAEHRARYWWAAQVVEGKDVLDVACGTGYGSEILRNAGAATVTGVDISAEAVEAAAGRAPSREAVIQGDIRELPLGDDSFDVAVCWETIEHVEEGERAVAELRRVLRPGGLLLVSSPNPDAYPPGNEHHVHEYPAAELADLVERHFSKVAVYGQHPWLASVIQSTEMDSDAAPPKGFALHARMLEPLKAGEETYALIAGTDGQLPDLEVMAVLGSAFEVRWWSEQLVEAQKVAAQAVAREVEVARRLDETSSALLQANQSLAQMPALTHQVEEMRHLVRGFESSVSWRITAPLRRLRRRR